MKKNITATRTPVVQLRPDQAVCPRCGRIRTINISRHMPLCRDCKDVLSAAERTTWEHAA